MAKHITDAYVEYKDEYGETRHDSLDISEYEEGYFTFEGVIAELLQEGCTEITIKIKAA